MEAISRPCSSPNGICTRKSGRPFHQNVHLAVGSRPTRFASSRAAAAAASGSEFDVVVVGAGIIGLTIANRFLTSSDLSVAVVDSRVPCSGATGAGQGYIWMGHKKPGSELWQLAMRSKQLWEELAETIRDQGSDPLHVLGWKRTGSLLVGRSSEELETLKERVVLLKNAGLRAEYLCGNSLRSEEPALGEVEGAALVLDDCQLDAHLTVEFILKGNRSFGLQGRYAEFFNDPVVSLCRSESSGEVEGVQTSGNILKARRAVVVAAGAWSRALMRSLLTGSNSMLDIPVKPRKIHILGGEFSPNSVSETNPSPLGHLLIIKNFNKLQLNHGVMEVGYIDHQIATQAPASSASEPPEHEQSLSSISMTATIDMFGNLVLVDGGKPIISNIPGLPTVLLATGHEGGGLCMALGTAEMVCNMVLGNPGKVDWAPFSVQERYLRLLHVAELYKWKFRNMK
ncbi:hypothetical protein QJS04_geneDACA014164 [Acorus gramineus]|uniref:FAD-dependent oxidoreductase domain-containing protein 1 n=1 Tax=Acorus gramineus TaxID=55184 RepID=A0AAV9B2F5_ACOGR|nr:hypothetical protein QJS04_geneDACA014164 [Acorus gramineus]